MISSGFFFFSLQNICIILHGAKFGQHNGGLDQIPAAFMVKRYTVTTTPGDRGTLPQGAKRRRASKGRTTRDNACACTRGRTVCACTCAFVSFYELMSSGVLPHSNRPLPPPLPRLPHDQSRCRATASFDTLAQ